MQLIDRLKNLWDNSPTTRNILKVSAGDLTSKLFSAATVFILIRALSISDYATYTTFSGVSYLFSGIVGAGINMALVRFSTDYLSRRIDRPRNLYFFALLLQLIIYIPTAGICFLFPNQVALMLLGQQALALPLQLGLAAGLGMLIIQYARSLYQAEEKFNQYIGSLWLVQMATFIILAVLYFLGRLSFLPAAVVFSAVQLGIGIWLLIKIAGNLNFPGLPHPGAEQTVELKRFLASSGWLIGYILMLNLFSRMDVLMLLRFRGKEELAIYGVAFQYYSLSLLFLGSIHAVLLPKFSKVDMQEAGKQKRFLNQWLQWSALLAIPIILFDAIGKPLFVWVNGSAYEKSFPVFVIFTFGVWLSMMFSPLVNILISKGNFRFLFSLGTAAFFFDILLNLFLVPLFGGIGAALSVVISIGIINFAAFLKIR